MADSTLYLIPTPLGDCNPQEVLPEQTIRVIRSLDLFIAEEAKTARRFLIRIGIQKQISEIDLVVFNEHSKLESLPEIMKPLLEGKNAGLLSEAGAPCIADPGADIVRMAHQRGIKVVPLTGPSSILLALMASGFNGQRFAFHGYLPIEKTERIKKIKEIERKCFEMDQTQIMIETPYRNRALFQDILATCRDETLLCLAVDITTGNEKITSHPIHKWKHLTPEIQKRPVVFLLYHQHSPPSVTQMNMERLTPGLSI